MKTIPVADITTIFVAVKPLIKDGVAINAKDGSPLAIISVLLPPTETEKAETMEVRVPSSLVAKGITPFGQVTFDGLTARPWSFKGHTGVTFEAKSVHVRTTVKEA